jgi:hypothetical protein
VLVAAITPPRTAPSKGQTNFRGISALCTKVYKMTRSNCNSQFEIKCVLARRGQYSRPSRVRSYLPCRPLLSAASLPCLCLDRASWRGNLVSRKWPHHGAANLTDRCLLWVRSGHFAAIDRCPLYPRKRTFAYAIGMSAFGQKQTRALQQSAVTRSPRRRRRATLAAPLARWISLILD